MKHTITLLGLIGTAALAALPVQAAPSFNAAAAAAGKTSAVEQVGYRRCWWRNGVRHCRWVDGSVDLNFGTRLPETYAVGTTDWWRAMDREGRGGFRR
jgi:hypothetical protein